MTKPRARIENWYVIPGPGETPWALVGEVRDHPNQDQFQSTQQVTSRVVKFCPEQGYAETQNTIYDLGKSLIPARDAEFCAGPYGDCGCA